MATYYEMAPAYQLGLHLAMGLEQETRWEMPTGLGRRLLVVQV